MPYNCPYIRIKYSFKVGHQKFFELLFQKNIVNPL